MKYIIELEKIEGTDLYKAKGCNTLVFDENGIKNILTPYEEETEREIDWTKVPKDTKVLVASSSILPWERRYFKQYLPEEIGYKFQTYASGTTSWSAEDEDDISIWRYCKLAEEPKEEWYK